MRKDILDIFNEASKVHPEDTVQFEFRSKIQTPERVEAEGRFFVTPHAVHRYIERLNYSKGYDQALAELILLTSAGTKVGPCINDPDLEMWRGPRVGPKAKQDRRSRMRFVVGRRVDGLPQVVTVLGHTSKRGFPGRGFPYSKGVAQDQRITVRQLGTGLHLYRDPDLGWRWLAHKSTALEPDEAETLAKRLQGVVCINGLPRGQKSKPKPKMPEGRLPGERNKREELLKLMALGDWRGAIKLASSFSKLGKDKAVIQRAWEAYQRPEFLRSIKKDPEEAKRAGIEALKKRYCA